MEQSQYLSVCNDTKWKELRNYVVSLETEKWPKFRSKFLPTGYIHYWDSEWFYHFLDCGFKHIEWYELDFSGLDLSEFRQGIVGIGLTGEVHENIIRIYGYVPCGSVHRRLNDSDFDPVHAENETTM